MTEKYSLEKMYEIWNDDTGECYQVGPDRDGLHSIEIRYVSDGGKVLERVSFTKTAAKFLLQAMSDLLNQ